MHKLLGVFLCLLLPSFASIASSSRDYFKTNTGLWKKTDRTSFLNGRVSVELLDSLDQLYAFKPSGYNFLWVNDQLHLSIGCSFDFYTIGDKGLVPKYKLHNRGYTCASYLFVRDSVNYLLGGNGLWTAHMDLLWLDEINGSWELTKTKNQPLNYHTERIFSTSDGIFALFGTYFNPRIDLNIQEPNGYFLDWKSKEWKRLLIEIEGIDNSSISKVGNFRFVETDDFVYMVLTNADFPNLGWNIIEKESGKIYFYESLRNEDVFISPFVEVIGNQIFYQNPNGSPVQLDLNTLKAKSKEVGKITIQDFPDSKDAKFFMSKDLAYSLVIVSLILFIGFNQWNRQQQKIITASKEEEIELLVQTLISYEGELLDTEKLDQVLGIHTLDNLDSKRLKRSRLINRVNDFYMGDKGKELIVRQKNPSDKRYVSYKIDV